MQYYVYLLLDPSKEFSSDDLEFEPFYVGKGKGTRYNDHLSGIDTNNIRKVERINHIREKNLEPIVKILDYYDIEEFAYNYEDFLIEKYGREDFDKGGILTNVSKNNRPSSEMLKGKTYEEIYGKEKSIIKKTKMSKSQKGLSRKATPTSFKKGHIPWNKGKKMSDDSRKRMSESMKGRIPWNKGKPMKEESKKLLSRQMKGRKVKPFSQVHKQKISKALKGKKKGPLSHEVKLKLSQSKKGIKQQIVKCPHCFVKGGISCMKRWHFDNCRCRLEHL